jgi:hypothetical protein
MQQPPAGAVGPDLRAPGEGTIGILIQLEPPGPQRVFRLESEASLQERIRQEFRQDDPIQRVVFPEEPVLSTQPYQGRAWPPQKELAEASYVCYGRLLFEEKNSERYGWDLGAIQPIVSASVFFKDVLVLPYHAATDLCRCNECSAGYCLPGDPVPYLLYPPEISLTGAFAETAAAVTLFAVFP